MKPGNIYYSPSHSINPFIFLNKQKLNGTKAGVLLHISDLVIVLYLIINALQQQAMLSMFR